jgi:hypothetical protein
VVSKPLGPPFKTAAWNGVFLNIPRSWETGLVDARYLVFEKDAKPAMEIKWQQVKGKFSAKSHFKRLAGSGKIAVSQWQPPSSWMSALKGFSVDGFEWQGREDSGRGVILWCPHCRTASLIQFLGDAEANRTDVHSEILASFGDHRDDGRTHWSLFDIRFLISDAFQMHDFAFQPGRYHFTLKNGGISVTLIRWAPAAVLLAEQGLNSLAANAFKKNPRDFNNLLFNGYPAVEWKSPKGSLWQRLRPRSEPRHYAGRVWHVESRNRILGVGVQGKKPLDDNLLTELCSSYEAL